DSVPPERMEDPSDGLVAPVRWQIEVDVGRIPASEVKQALEVKPVDDRIDGGESEEVGHERAHRGSPADQRDPVRTRVLGNLCNDQEVVGERAPADDTQLIAKPRVVLGSPPAPPAAAVAPSRPAAARGR